METQAVTSVSNEFFQRLSYEGRRVVVTGAASGIGRATAQLLIDLGAEVYSLDLVAAEVGNYIHVDLRDPTSITKAVARIGAPVHGLFNSAGVGTDATPNESLLVNFVGTRQVIDCVVPLMPPESAIVTVSSSAGARWREHIDDVRNLVETRDFEQGRAWIEATVEESRGGLTSAEANNLGRYALHTYTVAKALQLAERGIRINTVSAFATLTPMFEAFLSRVSPEIGDTVAGIAGRRGLPEELAYVLAFVNSAAGGYINGTDLLVDGGSTAASGFGGDVSLAPLEP
jgi:NAD(P)-dependent dehydrogenase (short-subunit alcohol dehydrogenase family)